jgi:hypothetical protein
MSDRFFVTIIAPDRQMLARLQLYDLDLFHASAQTLAGAVQAQFATRTAAVYDECCIEGLVTLEDIGQLATDGYQVVVNKASSGPTPAQTQIIEFEQWLKEMEDE